MAIYYNKPASDKKNLEELPWENVLTDWLDTRFKIPGTQIRFGLDGLLGLIPGVGDVVTNIFALLIIGSAASEKIPLSILFRMILNSCIDAVIGAIPVFGDVFDLFYKSNLKNLRLLQRYRALPQQTRKSSLVWVVTVMIVSFLVFTVLVFSVVWIVLYLVRFFTS